MKNILILMTIFLSTSSLSLPTEKLTIGLFNSKPFAYQNGKVKAGIIKKLADEIFQPHFDITYLILPYTRIISRIGEGKLDLTIMYSSEAANLNAKAISKTLGNDNVVVSYKDKNIVQFESIKGRTIGVLRGAYYGKEFSTVEHKKKAVGTYDQSVKLLLNKRVDAIFISSAAWKFYVKSMSIDQSNFNVLKLNFTQNTIFVKKDMNKNKIEKIKKLNLVILDKYKSLLLDDLL